MFAQQQSRFQIVKVDSLDETFETQDTDEQRQQARFEMKCLNEWRRSSRRNKEMKSPSFGA